MPTLPPVEVQISRPDEQQDQIAPDEGGQNPKVPPSRVEADAKRRVELVADPVGAVRAVRRRVVLQIPRPAGGEEGGHVLPARLAGGGGEAVELARRADDGHLVQLRGHQAGDEAGEGVELVQPGAPEAGDGGLGDGDAAEEGEDDDDEGVEEDGDEGARRPGGDGLGQGDGEELGDEDDEEVVPGA